MAGILSILIVGVLIVAGLGFVLGVISALLGDDEDDPEEFETWN